MDSVQTHNNYINIPPSQMLYLIYCLTGYGTEDMGSNIGRERSFSIFDRIPTSFKADKADSTRVERS
jgi:hypothetical protein